MTNRATLHNVIEQKVGGRVVGKTHAHLECLLGQIMVSWFWDESPRDFVYVTDDEGALDHAMRIFFTLVDQKGLPSERRYKRSFIVLDRRVQFLTLADFQMSDQQLAGRRCYVEPDFDLVTYNEVDNKEAIRCLHAGRPDLIKTEVESNYEAQWKAWHEKHEK